MTKNQAGENDAGAQLVHGNTRDPLDGADSGCVQLLDCIESLRCFGISHRTSSLTTEFTAMSLRNRWPHAAKSLFGASLLSTLLLAQTPQKPLTNSGVMQLIQAGLSESVIVTAIQSRPANYDVSTDALIKLKQAGATPDEMKAILAAEQSGNKAGSSASAASVSTSAGQLPTSASQARWEMPSVAFLTMRSAQVLPIEKAQLEESKIKPHSLASLAGDSALTQGMQAGVNDAAWGTATHMNNGLAGAAVLQTGGIFSGLMGRRSQTTTYVWGVAGPSSSNVLHTTTPKFGVTFAKAPGVNPDEFAPKIVKLTPAQNSCRLVGATQGKEDARSDDAADWEIYSAFVEDPVPTNLEKIAQGDYNISPQTPLLPGEYAVVLRPVSKSMRISGGDVARAQGPGLMFTAVWSFHVASNAQ
jgi:hypothetical protein